MDYQTLIAAVAGIRGNTFAGLDTITTVKLTGGQKNPQQGRVQKRMTGARVQLFNNETVNGYEAMVRRRLAAEGRDPTEFQVGARAWGHRLPNLPIVEHNGAYYLEVIFHQAGQVEYLLDGRPVDESAIQGLPERSKPTQAGLENSVIIRTFAAESVVELRALGGRFQ